MARQRAERLLARARARRDRGTRSRSSTRGCRCKNPVMFIVELGSVITTGIFILDLARGDTATALVRRRDRHLAVADGAVRELRRGDRRGPRQGAGERAARDADDDDRAPAQRRRVDEVPAPELQRGDVVIVVRPAR